MFVLQFILSINTLRVLKLRTEPDSLVGLSEDKILNLELKPTTKDELNRNGVIIKNRVVYFYRSRSYFSMGLAAEDITVKGHKADISVDEKMEAVAAFKHTKMEFVSRDKSDGESKGTTKESTTGNSTNFSPFNFSFVGSKGEHKEVNKENTGAKAANSASFFAGMGSGPKQGSNKLANMFKKGPYEGTDSFGMNGNKNILNNGSPSITENLLNKQPAYVSGLNMAAYSGQGDGNVENGAITRMADLYTRGPAGPLSDPRQKMPMEPLPDPYSGEHGGLPPDPYQRGLMAPSPDPYQRGLMAPSPDPYQRDVSLPEIYQREQKSPLIDSLTRKSQNALSDPLTNASSNTSDAPTRQKKSRRRSYQALYHIESDSSMEKDETNQIHQACIHEVSERHFQLKNDNLCVTYFKEQFIFAPCTKSKSQHFMLIDAKKLIENEESESEEQPLTKRRKIVIEKEKIKEVVNKHPAPVIIEKMAKEEPKEKKAPVIAKAKESDNFIEQLKSTFDEKAIKEIINM